MGVEMLILMLIGFMLIAALVSVSISGIAPSYEYNNIAEWNFTLMLNTHFVLCAWGWRGSGLSLFLGAGR